MSTFLLQKLLINKIFHLLEGVVLLVALVLKALVLKNKSSKKFIGSYNRRPEQGRKRSTDARDDCFLGQSALRNKTVTGTMLKDELAIACNVMISSRTVRRRLNEAGLSSRRPAKKSLLTREYRVARLRFVRNHQNWTVDGWNRELFSDETRVNLKSSDRRERVWRSQDRDLLAAILLKNLMEVLKYFGKESVLTVLQSWLPSV
ncbi:hypothetical protein ILUMI_15707 [Ignelater luminosus]|uniref:Transposase Tc1-like domain-containing protein n=1 Tax=Ignelater luminosus TaxID=2038154 RepID=A0A8K0CRR1_IGNLU|nr:hypothetical protein ILUMI_15707 [Ignelater luminosus]